MEIRYNGKKKAPQHELPPTAISFLHSCSLPLLHFCEAQRKICRFKKKLHILQSSIICWKSRSTAALKQGHCLHWAPNRTPAGSSIPKSMFCITKTAGGQCASVFTSTSLKVCQQELCSTLGTKSSLFKALPLVADPVCEVHGQKITV